MNRHSLRVKAVIFDMDGVITDTMPYHLRAWQKALREEGIGITFEEIYAREGQPGHKTIKELFLLHQKVFSEAQARRILKKKEVHFKKHVKIRFIRGARALLRHLHSRGFVWPW